MSKDKTNIENTNTPENKNFRYNSLGVVSVLILTFTPGHYISEPGFFIYFINTLFSRGRDTTNLSRWPWDLISVTMGLTQSAAMARKKRVVGVTDC